MKSFRTGVPSKFFAGIRMDHKPNLFIVGAPRCGTTAMSSFLGQHPDIFMARQKELHFFGSDLRIATGARQGATYKGCFEKVENEAIIGEASVFYLYSKLAAVEIARFQPDAKIIIMLRDPVDMIHSLHWQQVKGGHEDIHDFDTAVAAEQERRAGRCLPPSKVFPVECFLYSEVAKVGRQTKRFADVFASQKIKIVSHEEFRRNPRLVFADTLKFLGVDSCFEPSFRVINSSSEDVRSRALRNLILRPSRWQSRLMKLVPCFLQGKGIGRRLLNLNRIQRTPPPVGLLLRESLNITLRTDQCLLKKTMVNLEQKTRGKSVSAKA